MESADLPRLDLIVFLAYILGICGWGIYWRRCHKPSDLFLAGRSMGWFPIGLSVMVTLFSAINFLAFPTEVMEHGLYVLASLPVFVVIAVPVTRIFIPFFHGMKLTSLYEYLEHRFDRRTRLLGSGLFILWRLFWMATAVYASALLLSRVTGIPVWLLIGIAAVASGAYTAFGGMRAVMWTDVAQSVILLGSITAALWMALRAQPEGWTGIWATASSNGNLQPFQPFDADFLSWDPRIRITLWSALIGTSVAFLTRYTADQMVVQRYFTGRSLQSVVKGFWCNVIAALVALAILTLLGLAIVASGSESDAPGMARFAAFAAALPLGLTGLLAAGLLAATMSSVDSGVNACLAAWMTDFKQRTPTGSHYRYWVWILTVAIVVLAFLVGQTGDLFTIVNRVINGIGSPLLALILLAMFSRTCNARGAWMGGLIGTIVSIWISFGWDNLALHYYALVNLAVTLIACRLASAITAKDNPVSISQLAWTWYSRHQK